MIGIIFLKNFNTIEDAIEHINTKLNNLFPFRISKQNLILLVCDGLDNLRNYRKEFIEKMREKSKIFTHLKIIVTSRPEKVPTDPDDFFDNRYKKLRLLPFNEHQIKEFFHKYLPEDVRYNDIVSKMSNDVTRQPLFCWILANSYSSGENKDLLDKLQTKTLSVQVCC